MTEEEFELLAAAYGGDLARWPEQVRGEAAAMARRVPRLGGLLQTECAFDERIGGEAPEVTADRAGAVMAAVTRAVAREREAAAYRLELWPAAPLAFAVCAILGFALGFAMSGTLSQGGPPQDAIAFLTGGGSDWGLLTR